MRTRLAILGEYEPGYEPQEATFDAIGHAADALGVQVDAAWLSSTEADERRLSEVRGLFLSPGPLYSDLDRALDAVLLCLRTRKPLIGTCSGFQHAVVALAREGGVADATHEEYGTSGTAVVTRLECSLAGTVAEIAVEPGTTAHRLYGRARSSEEHRCNYGLNPEFLSVVESVGAVVSARAHDGSPRIVELPGHPYFLVTLFVPQLLSRPERPHPLIVGFVASAAQS